MDCPVEIKERRSDLAAWQHRWTAPLVTEVSRLRSSSMPRLLPGWRSIHNAWFMQIARKYLISGRVQGVGFRAFTEAQAAVEGLHGWVRNLADGRVEVFLEGDEEAVDRAEAKLRRGPGGARIQDVIVDELSPSGRAMGFTIRS